MALNGFGKPTLKDEAEETSRDRAEEMAGAGSVECYDVRSNTIFPIRRGSFRNEIKKGSRVQ